MQHSSAIVVDKLPLNCRDITSLYSCEQNANVLLKSCVFPIGASEQLLENTVDVTCHVLHL